MVSEWAGVGVSLCSCEVRGSARVSAGGTKTQTYCEGVASLPKQRSDLEKDRRAVRARGEDGRRRGRRGR